MKLKPQTVRSVSLKCETALRETPYMLIDNEADWFSRMAWRFLKWRKVLWPFMASVDTWTFVPHEHKDLNDAIVEAIEAAADLYRVFDGNYIVIIGTKTFRELTGSPAFRDYLMFEAGPFGADSVYRGRTYGGIPLHVIPSMEGLAVIPKAVAEKPTPRHYPHGADAREHPRGVTPRQYSRGTEPL